MPPGTTWQFPYLIFACLEFAWALQRETPAASAFNFYWLIYLSVLRGVRGEAVKEVRDWDRDEIIVCMVGAFCLGNALITVIYRLVG